jgi:hypothetical protein
MGFIPFLFAWKGNEVPSKWFAIVERARTRVAIATHIDRPMLLLSCSGVGLVQVLSDRVLSWTG